MRKPAFALSLAMLAGIGAATVGGAQAATTHGSFSSVASQTRNDRSAASGSSIVQYALRFLGYPYTAVGNSPSTGFSCIGFVSYVYRSNGINLPGDLGGAFAFAPPVAFSNLQPGDILYFQNTVWNGLSHAAIYIGGGRLVHAEWYTRGVVTSSFTNDPVDGNYWTDHYLGANRPWTRALSPAVTSPRRVRAQRYVRKTYASPVRRTAWRLPSGPTVQVHVPSLNVRTGPSIDGSILASTAAGTHLIILGRHRNWYRVALPHGATGWVVGSGIGKHTSATRAYATRAHRVQQRHVRTTRHTRQSVSTRTQYVHRSITRTKNIYRSQRIWNSRGSHAAGHSVTPGVRVHARPSLSSPAIGLVADRAHVRVLSSGAGWAKVRLSTHEVGYVLGQFVK